MISDEAFEEIKEYIMGSTFTGSTFTGSFNGIGEPEAIQALIGEGKLREVPVMLGLLTILEKV